jgi:L-2-hydroxyglutarate oxidase
MDQNGILVVARSDAERSTLAELHRRARANGVAADLVSGDDIPRLEPHARGIAALHAPEGASFDAAAYVAALLSESARLGAEVRYGVRVVDVREGASAVTLRTTAGALTAGAVVNCAGLHADRLAGPVARDVRVVPFRGYYAELVPERRGLVRAHVYAVPDLDFPFLGVHLSRRTDGRVIIGPGAMLAFGREAYRLAQLHPRDLWDMVCWPGFRRLVLRRPFRALARRELMKSVWLGAIAREARLLVPALATRDLVRSYAGNRAQLVTRDGQLVDDLLVAETARTVHVLNAVSPGLTCSLPFGDHVAARALTKLDAPSGERAVERPAEASR